MPGKHSSSSLHWQFFSSGLRKLLSAETQSTHSLIVWFIVRAIVLYALLFWLWSYAVPSYVDALIPFANKELQVLGLSSLTRLGPSTDARYQIGVYNRDAAKMEDALFNINLESIRSHLPMVLALVCAMTMKFSRRLKAAVIGFVAIFIIDSIACILIMSWSYIFLPDQHKFTPFAYSYLRDTVVNFLYYFYAAFGGEIVPVIVWALAMIRRQDIQMFTVAFAKNVKRKKTRSSTH